MKKQLSLLLFTAILSTASFAAPTFAQEPATEVMQPPKTELKSTAMNGDVIPVVSAQDSGIEMNTSSITHPPLRMTPDRSEIIRLSGNVGSVIVGNPNHLNIMADSANRLIAVPRAPGASFFTVLDENGNVLMQRHVIVASAKEKYVRIRRNCPDGSCQATSVYYCPDMCHEIMLSGETGGGSAPTDEPLDNDATTADDVVEAPPPIPEGQ